VHGAFFGDILWHVMEEIRGEIELEAVTTPLGGSLSRRATQCDPTTHRPFRREEESLRSRRRACESTSEHRRPLL